MQVSFFADADLSSGGRRGRVLVRAPSWRVAGHLLAVFSPGLAAPPLSVRARVPSPQAPPP